VTRSEMFKSLALGGVSAAAVRAFPEATEHVVSVNGPLHLHGDSHMITGCVFHLPERAPVIEIHDNKLLGGYS
jgi:hypothetical protein